MRTALVVALLSALLAGCGGYGDRERSSTTPSKCRAQWTDLAQYHGENGNPDPTLPGLGKRWDELDREARRLSNTATGRDCGSRFHERKVRWAQLEGLMSALQDYDIPRRLAGAEHDRRDFVRRQRADDAPTRLPRGVAAAFARLRKEAPLARSDMAAVLWQAKDADLNDGPEVKAYLRRVHETAAMSRHVRRAVHELHMIQGAELDEE